MKKVKENKKGCHPRVFLSGISLIGYTNKRKAGDSRTLWTAKPSGRTASFGFTLIELLVVVLIIGILAAIALPQYQKAVLKSRLAQWDVSFNASRKAIELYLLENGWPDETVFFTGKNSSSTFTMPGNCDDDYSCFTSAGRLRVYCHPTNCAILYHGKYNADGTSGNKAVGDDEARARFLISKAGNSYFDDDIQGKAGCLWVSTHPDIPVKSTSITRCKNTYGVTLPNPEYTE